MKKIQHLAFSDKIKIVKSYIPEKVKIFIEENLFEELNYFQKKYLINIELLSDKKLIIPEFKIELLNKSKKILNKIEKINNIQKLVKIDKETKKEKKERKKSKKDLKKTKPKKKLRTLWVRRKKKN